MSKVLGLDIGISSVGWGIIDQETGEILDAGVRLFEEAGRNANEERRSFRSSRRLKRRRNHRLERACQLFDEYKLPRSGIGQVNPYQARFDAIYNKVTKEELVAALYHLAKRRGTVLDSPDEEKTNGSELSTKKQLLENKKYLTNKYICEVQLERLSNKQEKMRNHENRFRTEDYVNEARAILLKQQREYLEITDDFINKFIELMKNRREYFEGPGSEKSPTPYGRFFINEKGQLEEITMIDKMRGNCTYFPEELRISKMSFTADLFNLLSGDLNKLQINGEYLTYEDKLFLVENFIKKGENITLPRILKYKGLSEDTDVSGYRRDLKTDRPTFTEFKGFKVLKKIVDTNQLPKDILDKVDLMDEIVEILTAEKAYSRREEKLDKILQEYDKETRTKIIVAFKETTEFKGYHALSKKAMVNIMEELWYTNKNQMELFIEHGLEQKRFAKLHEQNTITFDDEAILSTVARRAHREAIKIVNAVRKEYGEMTAIVVETAREKNSDEKRKIYADFQRKMGKHEKAMAKLLGVKSLEELKLSSKQHLALKLWESQDGKCVYSGKSISVNDIVQNPSLFEVDHILPISLSFDDSQANKVLCYHGENQKKSQRTPYQYFSSGKASRSYDQFKVEVLNLYRGQKINSKKKDYLLEVRDIEHNEELQKEFINRNLVDTQYAMRSFSMTLRSFFKTNHIDTKVFSIRGSFTASLRRHAKLNKDREESYAHHAIDALIVAAIGRLPVFKFYKDFGMNEEGAFFNRDTGEILTEDQFFEHRYIKFLRNLRNVESKVKYSHKVDRKVNRSMSNQTIYGTREKDGEEYVLGKSSRRPSTIYTLNKKDADALIKKIKERPNDFLISQYNPELLGLIQKIIDEYKNADNPFKAYFEEHGYIMKDGKVPIKTLRYLDGKLGRFKDITKKYKNSRRKVVLQSIKSLRIDFYKNGEGNFKYIGVPYHWFKQQGNKYILDMDFYDEEKKNKGIDTSFTFQFSLYKNDLFSYEKKGEKFIRIFRGDNDTMKNKLEVASTDIPITQKNRQILYTSSLVNIIKYNVDVLGNTYKIGKENFKNTLQL